MYIVYTTHILKLLDTEKSHSIIFNWLQNKNEIKGKKKKIAEKYSFLFFFHSSPFSGFQRERIVN